MVWAIAGGGMVLVMLVTGFVIRQRRGIAPRGRTADPAQVWLHGDPGQPLPARDDPGAGGGPDTAGDSGSDSGAGDSGGSD